MVQTTYETYKPSGIEWIGEVPKHWDKRKIGRSFNTIGSGTTPDAGKDDFYEEGTINWLLTGDLNDGVITECSTKITQSAFDKHSVLKLYPKHSVVIALYGATIGKTGYLNIEATTNQACCVLSDSPYLLPKFSFYLLNAVKDKLIIESYGGGQPNISQDIIKQLRIFAPPKSEQLAIANYLDDQTQKIDRLIANKKAQAEKLKELRQIEINNAVTKGLNPNAEMKDSGIEWLGKIPMHWEVKRLKDISSMQSGESITSEDFVDDGEYPVYGGNGLRGYFGSYTHEGNYVLIGRQGALCGNINYASGKFWASEHAVVISPKKKLDFFWLGELLRNMNLNQYSLASAQPGLSVEKILFLKVPFPPFEEQIKIANYLQQRTTAIDQLIKNIEAQIEKLQELRKIKIYEAVTGKIKV